MKIISFWVSAKEYEEIQRLKNTDGRFYREFFLDKIGVKKGDDLK